MHQSNPGAERCAVHGQHVVLGDEFEPRLDLSGLGGILISGEFYAGLDLTERDRGQMKISILGRLTEAMRLRRHVDVAAMSQA